ncbi:DsbA family protein [Occallatibacter riparius]|uniref:Thioredoxin domain-containing protein n=1 Tax=Occallatibacter riparius TaxID=1002689 RepID=A0A9J7BYQ7_9BACT|nr:thioredoxin domain-containing protein [Occallatibacter riparius]UWZ86502.1 thioredoxin domain-containing protein [Occallatibacter riparius]
MVYKKSLPLRLSLAVLLMALGITALAAQSGRQPTSVKDASALHPPAGANVAIVEFSDLECPACARANPYLMQAAAQYKIPWVRHDLLIPSHPWSPTAAVNARWFDEKGNGLGDAYRNAVFANQSSIYNVNVLATFTQKFAQSHGVAMPFAVDPQGKLMAAVKADTDLGMRTGVTVTPTVFVVTAHSKGAPYIEVLNPETDLFRTIDQALADTKQPAGAARHK